MYLQEILEVAIGLIFVWLVFSIATMQIQEWFVTYLLKWRSTDLQKTIGNMLKDREYLSRLYEHPLIQGLTEPLNEKKAEKLKAIKEKENRKEKLTPREKYQRWVLDRKPSYIPAATFTTALFDIVTKAGTGDSPIQKSFASLRTQIEKLKQGDQETANKLVSYLVNLGQTHAGTQVNNLKATLRREMLTKLTELEKVGSTGQGKPPLEDIANELRAYVNGNRADELAFLLKSAEPYLDQVREGALHLGSVKLGETLHSLLAGVEEAATDVDKAIALGRKSVEHWFDSTMERLSGWYKRKSQLVTLIIGLVLAITLNVDSIALAKHLWREPAVRQALAATADKYITETEDLEAQTGVPPEDAIEQFKKRFDGLTLPIGWELYGWSAVKEENGNIKCEPLEQKHTIGKKVESFIVQPPARGPVWGRCIVITNLPPAGETGIKVFGMVLTALAAMQGAPFWFDILKKLVNVRSSGANPADKPKEDEK